MKKSKEILKIIAVIDIIDFRRKNKEKLS